MHYVKSSFMSLALLVTCLTVSTGVLAIEPLDRKGLDHALSQLIDSHPTAKRTTVTLKVVDLENGEVLYDRGGGKLLVPASNLKIYTAAAALDLLGPGYRWLTQVVATRPVRNGVCEGDLVLRGTGDPMMDTEQFALYADMLVMQRLRTVRGDVVVETAPRWAGVPLKGPGWMWDDDPDYYNMSIRTMMLNFNTVKVTVSHGDKGAEVTLDPASDYPPVVKGDVPDDVSGDEPGDKPGSVRITRAPFDETIYVYGNPGPETEPVSQIITVHDPSPWIASVFKRMLEDRGVSFTKHRKSSAERDEVVMLNGQGKTLAEAIKHFLMKSENAVGEMILLKLAETQTEGDVSWPAGAKVISDWLVKTAGLEEGSFRIVDGSGLSRYNRISADSAVMLLAYMKTHKYFDVFYAGLNGYKVALPEGEKWDGVPLKEIDAQRVHAKSGGMQSVATLSGYVQTLDGRWLAFSFLANGYLGSNQPVFDLRGKVWAELVRYRPTQVTAEVATEVPTGATRETSPHTAPAASP